MPVTRAPTTGDAHHRLRSPRRDQPRRSGLLELVQMEAKDDDPRMVILDLGGHAALFAVFEVPEGEIIVEQRRRATEVGIDHFAIVVDSA